MLLSRNARIVGPLLAVTTVVSFPEVGWSQTVDSVTPDQVVRGATTDVTISGSGLEVVVDVSCSEPGVTVSLVSADPSEVVVELIVGDAAAAGAIDLTLSFMAGPDLLLDGAVMVVAGDPDLTDVVPDSGSQGELVSAVLTGKNLDAVVGITIDPDVLASNYVVLTPTSVEVDVSIDAAAVIGSYDVTLTTTEPFTFPNLFAVTAAGPDGQREDGAPADGGVPGDPVPDGGAADGGWGDVLLGDPLSGDPLSGDPLSGDPSVGDPPTGDPSMGDSFPGDPSLGDPFSGDAASGDPAASADGGDPSIPGGTAPAVDQGCSCGSPASGMALAVILVLVRRRRRRSSTDNLQEWRAASG